MFAPREMPDVNMHLASPGSGERAICTTPLNGQKHKLLILKGFLRSHIWHTDCDITDNPAATQLAQILRKTGVIV